MFARASLLWRQLKPKTQHLLIGISAGVSLPFLSAFLAGAMDTYLHVRAPSMTFLCSVIAAAIFLGRRAALLTALFAFFIYNFYLTEPRNTFGFAGVEDVLTLLIFVGTALIVGGLAGHLHDERERAREQARIFAGLFDVSRSMAVCRDEGTALSLLASGVQQIAASEAIVIQAVVARQHHAPDTATLAPEVTAAVRAMLVAPESETREVEGWRVRVVGAKPVAALAWKPLRASSGEHDIAVRLLIELTLSAIERTQSLQRQIEMDSLAATERLRTALMSSISHDFRTPLSTILTSASSLQAYGDQFSAATRSDLLTTIQEEAERLNRFVRNILDMTRLDAGVLKPREEWIDPLEIIDNVSERIRERLAGRALDVAAPAAVPSIFVDPLLLEQAIVNVLENALVHTPAGSTVRIGAEAGSHAVLLWVQDDGPGVPSAELPAIFDKFHRVANTQNTQGAGLGLAISKGFVEAMNGQIRALSPANGGLRIELSFPLQATLADA